MNWKIYAGFAVFFCFNVWAGGENNVPLCPAGTNAGDFPPRPQIVCVRTSVAPSLDGRLDDLCWKNAMEAGPFALISGSGFPAEQSRAYLVHDDENLYIGVVCDESLLDERLQRTHEIKREVRQRDGDVWKDDCVELFFQPEASPSGKYYHIAVNSLGTVCDAVCATAGNMDKSWDSQAKVAVSASARAWCVEMAIPKKNLQLGMKPGAAPAFNICRNRPSSGELSGWSPTGNSFHNCEAFGILRMLDAAPASRAIAMPRFIEGDRAVSLCLRNTSSEKVELKTFAHVRHETGDWDSFATAVSLDVGQEKSTLISCFFGGENRAFLIDASEANMDKTLCFRTDCRPIRPETEHRISAMVRAENLSAGNSPVALSFSSYDSAGKGLAGQSYITALAVPSGSYGWKRIEGRWRSPASAAGVTLWTVKWSNSGVRGKLWVDDIRFSQADTPHLNLIANGSLQDTAKREMREGWSLSGVQTDESYPKGKNAQLFFQICGKDGEIFYSSPVYSSELAKKNSVIGSSLLLISAETDETYSLKALYVAQKGYLYLPVVFESAVRGTIKQCQLTIETPAFLRLADPYPGAILLSKEAIQRDGAPYYRHILEYPGDAVSLDHPKKNEAVINPLIFHCDATADDRPEGSVYYRASVGGRLEEEENKAPLTVLPLLQWKRPEQALIMNWPGGGLSIHTLNGKEQELVLQTIRLSGFTQITWDISKAFRKAYGFRGQFNIPLVTASGGLFPGGAEYLRANPQARAVTAEGVAIRDCFCPTYFLSEENKNRIEMEKWLSQKAKEYEQLDWDYEVSVTGKDSICFCARCIRAFQARAQIPASPLLTAGIILSQYKKEWVDFRCRQNADIAGLFREPIKKGNPDCIFSIYSGYQGDTDERYGVDWKYMSKPCDLVWCGYGRWAPMIAATQAALEGRPLIGGELAWFGNGGYYDCAVARTVLFRRLSDCGSGIMTFYNWVVDGRFYAAVSAVAGVMADFEQFFVADKDKDGFYHSRYRRNDGLVRVGGDGNAGDATVLVRGGERLIFVFNETKKTRSFEIENLEWRDGMTCLDYFNKTTHGAKASFQIPPLDVRVLHVLQPSEKDIIDAPELMQPEEQERLGYFPVMAWRGKGSRPGDQMYNVEIRPNGSDKTIVAPDWRVVGSNLAETAYALPWQNLGLEAGGSYLWRVQARDVVSGKSGPYSSPAAFRIPIIEEVNFFNVFSPNGDGCFDQFILRAFLTKDMPWTVRFSSSSGKLLRVFEGRGKDIVIRWDGNDLSGNAVGEGDFTFEIQGGGSAVSAYKGKASLNMKTAGVVNPAFAVCRNFALRVSGEGMVKMENDYTVTRGKTCSIRMNAGNKASGYWSNYNSGVLTKRIPVTPGKKYAFRAYLKSDLQSGSCSINLMFFKASWGWATPGKHASDVTCEPVTGKTDWAKREVVLQAPPTADSAVFFFSVNDAAGTCWFDDMEFSEVE